MPIIYHMVLLKSESQLIVLLVFAREMKRQINYDYISNDGIYAFSLQSFNTCFFFTKRRGTNRERSKVRFWLRSQQSRAPFIFLYNSSSLISFFCCEFYTKIGLQILLCSLHHLFAWNFYLSFIPLTHRSQMDNMCVCVFEVTRTTRRKEKEIKNILRSFILTVLIFQKMVKILKKMVIILKKW